MRQKLMFNGNIIDIEASGFSSNSYPIEIGIVTGSGKAFEATIKPHEDWKHWCRDAESIHGLTRKYLENFGTEINTLCHKLNELCQGQTFYSDAWQWDSFWLNRLFNTANVRPTFRCSPIEYFVSDFHRKRWIEYKSEYADELYLHPHRALNDAKIISTLMYNEEIVLNDNILFDKTA